MRRVWVDPAAPQRDALEEAAKWILAGRIVDSGQDMPLPVSQSETPALRNLRSGYYEMGAVAAHLV